MSILGDYISIKHGFAFKGEGISSEDNGIVLVTPGNFSVGGGFKEDKCKFFVGDYPSEYVLSSDDLIVTMTDLSKEMDTLGYSALVPDSNRVYLHNQRIGLISIHNNELDKHFLYWFMRTHKYQRTIAGGASGTTVHHTSPSRICEVGVNFPDLATQKRIAGILDDIESKIKVNAKINQNLSQQIQTIYDNLVGEIETAPVEISTVIDVRDGTHDSPKAQETGFPLVTSKHLLPYGVDLASPNKISKNDYDKINERSRVETNDILLSMIGTVGLISLIIDNPVEFAIKNVGLFKTSANPELYPYVLTYLRSNSTKQYIDKVLAGSTQKYISLGELRKMPIALPSTKQLNSFNAVVKPVISQITNIVRENNSLIELRDTLLPKLVNGELDVSDIEV